MWLCVLSRKSFYDRNFEIGYLIGELKSRFRNYLLSVHLDFRDYVQMQVGLLEQDLKLPRHYPLGFPDENGVIDAHHAGRSSYCWRCDLGSICCLHYPCSVVHFQPCHYQMAASPQH